MANRLSGEKSPYLLQHKDNPVDWYPWCSEAFQKAASEDKPIFLSIGYSTCHWCHVMAHESFEDEEIAALLKDYVCIKVDREERPDIDAVYMSVCQALTGSGGWPLTVFMTAGQKPFFTGTYFPKTSRYGQMGLSELLTRVTKLWRTQRQTLLSSGDKIAAVMQNAQATPGNMPGDIQNNLPDKKLLLRGFGQLKNTFDKRRGGFGAAPKFPAPHNLLFLMRLSETESKPEALQMAEITLKAMAAGGIFDHIGGGFSRYSTDEKWLAPHFEKMLYDNALLLLAYLEAFQRTENECYAETARRTADYLLRELANPGGGFYCGQDADSDGVEGKYYLLAPDEVIAVLGKMDGTEFCRLYDITETGNFEGENIPNRIGKKDAGWRFDDPRFSALLEYRKRRTRLHLDQKILLSWNGWTMMALAKAGTAFGDSRYLESAVRTHEFIEKHMTDTQNRLFLRYCSGEAAHTGQLDDYAVYALALTELYRQTLNIHYLKEAVLRAEQMIDLFEDAEHGGYFMTAHDAETLITRPKECYDGAIPSGNSAAAMVLERLAALTGKACWREAADRQFNFIAGQISEYPSGHCFALLALAQALYPRKELLVTGREVPGEILDYIGKHPMHSLSVLFQSPENRDELAELAPFTGHYPSSEHPVWYLCENGACHTPETDFHKLALDQMPH